MLTQAELKSYLHYNLETGIFTWKVKASTRTVINGVAGTYDKNGYRAVCIKSKKHFMHRLAWLYVYGEFPKNDIDHINMVKDDNRIANLRDVSRAENKRNLKINSANTSGFQGVTYSKKDNRYIAQIIHNGKHIHLGTSTSPEIAFEYYRKFHNEHYGHLKSW